MGVGVGWGGGVWKFLFWGFGVITSYFGGGRATGWGLISRSFLSRAVGRRLIFQVKIGGWGLGSLIGALDLDSFVMEGEREQRRIDR